MVTLENKDSRFWEAMAWWLQHEKVRHLKDIQGIERDLDRLRAMGVSVPDEKSVDIWVEIPTKS
jgi:hypothetical protein